jgi:hypothetical protein
MRDPHTRRIEMQRLLAAAALLALGAGCGDKDKPSAPDTKPAPDTTARAERKLLPDLGLPPDIGQKQPCESEWRDAIHAQLAVSTGAVATTEVATGVKQTTVDATAGGMAAAFSNPYVYVSLEGGGARVDLDDLKARGSSDWDLAFRRAVIRVNGGDSGAGQGAVAILPGKTLEEVAAAPPASDFAQDDFLDAACKVKTNPINDIWTAIGGSDGMWYVYDASGTKPPVSPKKEAYVVRGAKGKLFKLVIDDYYSKSGAGANYTLRWSPL